jgi:hypothetical protein
VVAGHVSRSVRAAQLLPLHVQLDGGGVGDDGLGRVRGGLERVWIRALQLPVQAGGDGVRAAGAVVPAHSAGDSVLPAREQVRIEGQLSRVDPGVQHLHSAALSLDHEGVLRADSA